MEQKQLDWIDSTLTREEKLEIEVKRLADQCEKMRKSLYARDAGLRKVVNEVRYDMDHIYAHICKNNIR